MVDLSQVLPGTPDCRACPPGDLAGETWGFPPQWAEPQTPFLVFRGTVQGMNSEVQKWLIRLSVQTLIPLKGL